MLPLLSLLNRSCSFLLASALVGELSGSAVADRSFSLVSVIGFRGRFSLSLSLRSGESGALLRLDG